MNKKNIRRFGILLAAGSLISQISLAGITTLTAQEPVEVTEQQLDAFAEENQQLTEQLDDALADVGQDSDTDIFEDYEEDYDEIEDDISQPEIENPGDPILDNDEDEVVDWPELPEEENLISTPNHDGSETPGEQPQNLENSEEEIEVPPTILQSGTYAEGGKWTFDSAGVLKLDGGILDLTEASAPWLSNTLAKADIKKVIIGGNEKVKAENSLGGLFFNYRNLAHVDFLGFNTSLVTNMGDMFHSTTLLTKINFGDFDTSSVTNMGGMFYNASALVTLDLRNFKTDNVTNMYSMFGSASLLETVDLSSFKTSAVTNMGEMFSGASSLQMLDLDNFDTSSVTMMRGMFKHTRSLQTLDLKKFKTENVTNMAEMFHHASSLQVLNLKNFDTTSVTDMNYMFSGATSLQTLDLGSFTTAKVTDMNSMFFNASALKELDLKNFNTSLVTDMSYMFSYMRSLLSLNIENFNTSKIVSMREMFNRTYWIGELRLGSSFVFVNPQNLSLMDPSSNKKWIHTANQNWSTETGLGLINYHNELVSVDNGSGATYIYRLVDRDSGSESWPVYDLSIPAALNLTDEGGQLPVQVDIYVEHAVHVGLSGNVADRLILRNEQLETTYFWSSISYDDAPITDEFGIDFWVSGTEILLFSAPELEGIETFSNLEFTAPLVFTASLIDG